MAASSVEIVSAALNLIGDQGITSLEDNSDRARLANRLYSDTLDEMLQEHNWNFATQRRQLALLTDPPIFGFDYMYQLPQDPFCLQVVSTNLDDDEAWRIETYDCGSAAYRVLLTDATCVSIIYLARTTDVTRYPALFVSALTYRLAAKFAYALTRNATLIAELEKKAQERLAKAKARDGQEGRALQRIVSTTLTEVR